MRLFYRELVVFRYAEGRGAARGGKLPESPVAYRRKELSVPAEKQAYAAPVALDLLLDYRLGVKFLHLRELFGKILRVFRDGVAVARLKPKLFAAVRLYYDGEFVRLARKLTGNAEAELDCPLVHLFLVVQLVEHGLVRDEEAGDLLKPLLIRRDGVQRRRADREDHRPVAALYHFKKPVGVLRVVHRTLDPHSVRVFRGEDRRLGGAVAPGLGNYHLIAGSAESADGGYRGAVLSVGNNCNSHNLLTLVNCSPSYL